MFLHRLVRNRSGLMHLALNIFFSRKDGLSVNIRNYLSSGRVIVIYILDCLYDLKMDGRGGENCKKFLKSRF